MDLNYLFHRQQVELIRADAALCTASGQAHRALAALYGSLIKRRRDAAGVGQY